MEPMMDCESVLRQVWDYLDGELPSSRHAEIAAHLQACERCYPTFKFEESFLRVVKSGERDSPAAGQLRDRVLAALRAQGPTDSPSE